MADGVDSHNIARRTFEVARRGYEQQEVRGYLHEISALVERLQRETVQLREQAERAKARLGLADQPDESMLLEILGEETTRVLSSARDAAGEIKAKAETAAERIVAEATTEAAESRAAAIRDAEARLATATAESEALVQEARTELERRRAEAQEAADHLREEAAEQAQAARDEGQRDLERIREEAAGELQAARQQGRDMVAEAQAVRERVLRDLASRRKRARQQVEKLNAGRERLLQAYDVVRRTIDEATGELATSLTDARLAADAAARRIEEEPEPTLEQLDDELKTAGLVDLPIVELDDPSEDEGDGDDAPGPFSGEVPAVSVTAPTEAADEGEAPAPPVDLGERRGRKRRKKDSFEGLPTGELTRVEPQAEGEGIRVIEESPPEVDEPEAPAAEVDDIFARLRAEQPADADEPDAEVVEVEVLEVEVIEVEATEVEEVLADPEGEADEPPTSFAERDAALDPIDKELGRRLKRALADEQNEVLDLLRRAKPKGVDDLLPSPDEHAARWTAVVADSLGEAAAAGATWAGGAATPVGDLAEELARSLTEPLRDRIDRSFAASDGNLDDVADRVRALYREWKGQRLTDTSRHYTAATYAAGAFAAVADDVEVQWVVDPAGDRCPDCDDNVIGGAVAKGTEFPTGHLRAPAHPGCRCLVVAVDR